MTDQPPRRRGHLPSPRIPQRARPHIPAPTELGALDRRRPGDHRLRRSGTVEQQHRPPAVHDLRPAGARGPGRRARAGPEDAPRPDRGRRRRGAGLPAGVRRVADGARPGQPAAGSRPPRGRADEGDRTGRRGRDRRLEAPRSARREPGELHRPGRRPARHRGGAVGVGRGGDHHQRRAAGDHLVDLRRRRIDPRQHRLPLAAVPDRGDRLDRLGDRFPSNPAYLGRVAHRIEAFGLEFATQATTRSPCPPSSATPVSGGPCRRRAADAQPGGPDQPDRRRRAHRPAARRTAPLTGPADRAEQALGRRTCRP